MFCIETFVLRGTIIIMIKLKRIYEEPSRQDGYRVLVDRLWPRGMTKEKAKIDLWLKDIAPSGALRTWFAHDVAKWLAFKKKYRAELTEHKDALAQIRAKAKQGAVTLLYAARDTEHNEALVIQEVLET